MEGEMEKKRDIENLHSEPDEFERTSCMDTPQSNICSENHLFQS